MQPLREESSNEPDYSSIDLPSKSRTEYGYVERRAELLQLVEEAGHPDALNQTELAEQFGVSQQQISKDFDRIASHVHDSVLNRDRRAFHVTSVVNRAVRGLLDEGENRKAAKTMMEFDEWLREFHELEQIDERLSQIEERQGRGGL